MFRDIERRLCLLVCDICCHSGFIYSPCDGDPRTVNVLTTLAGPLTNWTFDAVMHVKVQTDVNINATIDVYQLTNLRQPSRKLGSLPLSSNVNDQSGPVTVLDYPSYREYVLAICAPSGSYSIMLIASSADATSTVNVESTLRVPVDVFQSTGDQCTYQHNNTTGNIIFNYLLLIHEQVGKRKCLLDFTSFAGTALHSRPLLLPVSRQLLHLTEI